MASFGWLTVVSDRWRRAEMNVLSKPTSDTSPGTAMPASARRLSAPAASRSLKAKMALGGSSSASRASTTARAAASLSPAGRTSMNSPMPAACMPDS